MEKVRDFFPLQKEVDTRRLDADGGRRRVDSSLCMFNCRRRYLPRYSTNDETNDGAILEPRSSGSCVKLYRVRSMEREMGRVFDASESEFLDIAHLKIH